MASEATILENAPVTPAHKFAWRAFRGFVYGSPESPENAVQQPSKDNAASPPRQSSPQKRVSVAANPPMLSPQKRKREVPPQVSPTKSILRTPGAPTPRAKGLRDFNVKFKSISPEARSGPVSVDVPFVPPEIAQLEQQVDELRQELEQSPAEAKSPPNVKEETSQTISADVITKTTTKISKKRTEVDNALVQVPATNKDKDSGDPCNDDYARRTEKEVKRLLRQHKKLRDYAQRADEQNVRLSALVQELQSENARLKGKLELVDVAVPPQGIAGAALSSVGDNPVGSKRGNKTITDPTRRRSEPDNKAVKNSTADPSESKTEAFKRSLRGEKPGFTIHEDSSRSGKPPRDKTIQSQDKLPPTKRSSTSDLPSSATTAHNDVQKTDTRPDPSSQSLRAPSSRTPSDPKPTIIQAPDLHQATDRPKPESSPFSLTALAAQLEPTPAPKHPPTSAAAYASLSVAPPSRTSSARYPSGGPLNMAPDRVAAARLRLAKRSEERKASQTTYLMEAQLNGDKGADSVGAVKHDEDSAVDWANI